MKLTISDLEDYARGCAFLGTGGGGDPYVGQIAVQQELIKGADIQFIQPEELSDDDLVVDICSVGATTVLTEKLLTRDTAKKTVAKMEAHLGKKITALIAAEIGGINAAMPLTVAAQTGLPVVDGDGMGRAFPQFEMCSFSIYGCSASPAVMMNDYGDSVIIDTDSDINMEKIARSLTVSMGGGCATVSSFPMTGRQVKDYVIAGTQSLSLSIGRAIRAARENNADPFEALRHCFEEADGDHNFTVIFNGKIIDLDRSTKAGFTVGKMVISAINSDVFSSNSDTQYQGTLEITFQNENLVAYKDGQLAAIVPDLIVILDSETAEPITTDGLKYGQRVKVIGLSCSPLLRTQEALKTVGPRAFGLDEDFHAIENIA